MDRAADDELISAYLDDELSAEERAYVERLLVERPEARRLLDELRGVRESLQALPSYRLEPDFSAAVLRQAEREVLRAPNETATVEPRRDVVEGGSSSAVLPPTIPRWRRPLAWSILAVAAAVVLMFVDRQGRREAQMAMHREGKRGDAAGDAKNRDELGVDQALNEKRSAGGEMGRLRTEGLAVNAPAPATPPAVTFGAAGGATAPKAGEALPFTKSAAPATPTSAAAYNVGQNVIATQPTAPSGQMAVGNTISTAGSGTLTSTPPATGQYSVQNRELSKVGAGTLVISGGLGTAAEGLASQSLSTLQMQTAAGNIDTTPLVAANDYQRAQELVTELNIARRDNSNEEEAIRSLSRKGQVPQVANPQGQARSPTNDQLLIVTIEVPNQEALDRCLLPVLQQQQIADLTPVRSRADATLQYGTLTSNAGPPPIAPTRDPLPANPSREEYFYVIANRQQIQGTLEALSRQSDMVVDLDIEPAPDNAQQQAWVGYNRGVTLDAAAKVAGNAKPVPTATPAAPVVAAPSAVPPLMKSAGALPAAPPALASSAAKAEVDSLERKNVAGNADKQTADSLKERGSSVAQQPKEATVGLGGGVQPPSQQADNYGYNLVPLSRSQRLRSSDAGQQLGLPSLPQVNSRFTVADERGGGKAPSTPAAAATPAASDSPKTASAPSPIAAPQPSSTVAKAKDDDATRSGVVSTNEKLNEAQHQPGGGGAKQADLQRALSYELPPDFHEALFICRIAPAATQAVQGAAASTSAPTAAGKPATSPARTESAPASAPADSLKPTPSPTSPRGKAD